MKKTILPLIIFSFYSVLFASDSARADDFTKYLNSTKKTSQNLLEYIQEKRNEILEAGGAGKFHVPQAATEGLGPLGSLTEGAHLIKSPFLASLFTFIDVPPIPIDLVNRVDPNSKSARPEIPAINRTVVGFTEEDGYTRPQLPPFRWTLDGRIGISSQSGGTSDQPRPVKLFLLAPEKLTRAFVDSTAGPSVMNANHFELPLKALSAGNKGVITFSTICEPYHAEPGVRKNPYSCGIGGEDDCYDITIVSAISDHGKSSSLGEDSRFAFAPRMDDSSRLMGSPVTVRVSNPKTTAAEIVEVSYGEPTFSETRTGVLFENITPADGRLVVARRGFMPLVWQHTATGKTQYGHYDIVYAVSPPDSEPCDVTQWGNLYPITHAPYDHRVNERYPFAKYPFRDAGGRTIADGVDIKGTYPWMDKEAKMLSMQVSPAKLFPTYNYNGRKKTRYPTRCVLEENCDPEYFSDSDNTKDNMFAIMGSWTHGKMVLLDGNLNSVDFRLGGESIRHSYLKLYQSEAGHDYKSNGEVRVGATRGGAKVPTFNSTGAYQGQWSTGNISLFDSIENRLNYNEHFQPSTPADVVWTLSSGWATAEQSFDDFLNPNAFIISEMVAYSQHKNNRWFRINYYDGWHQPTQSFIGQVKIQNSATTLPDIWKVPKFGYVKKGRLEPVANGGIFGKGMWFNGKDTSVEYRIPAQKKNVSRYDWFYSMFLDPRNRDNSKERVLLRFPDGSKWTLKGLRRLKLVNRFGEIVAQIKLNGMLKANSWNHLALAVNASNSLEIFMNGYPYWRSDVVSSIGEFDADAFHDDAFRPTKGLLSLGGPGSTWFAKKGFKGWMDEFKVFAYKPDIESICNQARGTMVALTESSEASWLAFSDNFDDAMHQTVSKTLNLKGMSTFDRYACYHDYSNDFGAHLKNLPESLISLREAIHFPEGPLYHDAPRPDSSSNAFCLSCHHTKGLDGLGLSALEFKKLDAKLDPRRQPSQPLAKVYGSFPANWLPGSPGYALATGDEGVWIDEWVLPSSEGVGPEIRNLVIVDAMNRDLMEVVDGANYSREALRDARIRANVNGIVREVVFKINNNASVDTEAPFAINLNHLLVGENQITVTARLADGSEVSSPHNVYISD